MIVAGLAFGGCAHQSPPAATAQSTTNITSSPVTPPVKHPHDIVVSDDIARACKLDLDNIGDAPKFDFDQSILTQDDASVLSTVAQCLTTGPLRGSTLSLVGRADPRGEAEYNLALGSSRANAVSKYMQGLGVSDSKLIQTSRGKLDATGTNESSWRLDRRVDLLLVR
jgi:peptidoglycan-associated lipoprotein